MDCPYCHASVELPAAPVRNMERYRPETLRVRMPCCRKLALLKSRLVTTLVESPYQEGKDDWGN